MEQKSMSVDQGTATQVEPIPAPKKDWSKAPREELEAEIARQSTKLNKPTVVFQGKGRVILFKNSQFKDADQFLKELVRVSEPMNVYVEDWTINGLADWSYKVVELTIRFMHFLERILLPKKYRASFVDGKLKIDREYTDS